jgi:hypothetical protein
VRRHLIIAAVVLLLLGGILGAAWFGIRRPPVRLILKYGHPPSGGPAGRALSFGGMEFAEIDAGVACLHLSPGPCFHPVSLDLLDDSPPHVRLRGKLRGLLQGAEGLSRCSEEWVEFPETVWISREPFLRPTCVREFLARRSRGAPFEFPTEELDGQLFRGYAVRVRLTSVAERSWATRCLGPPEPERMDTDVDRVPLLGLFRLPESKRPHRFVWIPPPRTSGCVAASSSPS